jgi:MerR family transcriptional regulator, repressor of the yfmOP operon
MSAPAVTDRPLRIGRVAQLTGTTARTIRYYEEIGLLPESPSRPAGGHRVYTEADVERVREIVRLRDLLGLSLDELKEVVEAETARAALRAEWHRGVEDPERRAEILDEALGHIDVQLRLVRRRQRELEALAEELVAKRRRLRSRRRGGR